MVRRFTQNLEVDKRIVGLLSKSTYQNSFSSAIRELVSNSYDADSLAVRIYINEDYSRIEIEDDGNGMTLNEFRKFLTIAGLKSSTNLTRRYKRLRIGHFGIGFLAIFPFCEMVEIISTAENSKDVLSAQIPSREFMESSKELNVQEIRIEGKITENKARLNEHFTRIRLVNPTYLVLNYFSLTDTKKRASVLAWDPFERFKWELEEDLPISFNPKGKSVSVLKYEEPIGLSVFLNNVQLFRHELPETLLENKTYEVSGLGCKFVVGTDYKSIKPQEARGVKIRVNNVAIGIRTDFQLKRDRGFSRLHWLAGELYLTSEAKEYLTISRDNFVTSPQIDQIRDFFSEKLRSHAYYVEDVAIAEKGITETLLSGKRTMVKSKNEIINDGLKVLIKKGFNVIDISKDRTSAPKVVVDKDEKKVYTTNLSQIPKNLDSVVLLNKRYDIYYDDDDKFDNQIPCRLDGNRIVINKGYPLFESKTYGDVFKKFHLLLLVTFGKSKDNRKMYNSFLEMFLDEFDGYI